MNEQSCYIKKMLVRLGHGTERAIIIIVKNGKQSKLYYYSMWVDSIYKKIGKTAKLYLLSITVTASGLLKLEYWVD